MSPPEAAFPWFQTLPRNKVSPLLHPRLGTFVDMRLMTANCFDTLLVPRRYFFFTLHHENLVDLRSKVHESVKAFLKMQLPGVSLSLYSSISSPIHQKYHLWVSTSGWLQQLLLQVSRSSLWLSAFTCLSRCWGGNLPCKISYVRGPWKLFIFNVNRYFLLQG